MDDFTVRPLVDLDVVKIMDSVRHSSDQQMPHRYLPMTSSQIFIHSADATQLPQKNCLAMMIAWALPRIKFTLFPGSTATLLKQVIQRLLRYALT
jgi:hypothetical protein